MKQSNIRVKGKSRSEARVRGDGSTWTCSRRRRRALRHPGRVARVCPCWILWRRAAGFGKREGWRRRARYAEGSFGRREADPVRAERRGPQLRPPQGAGRARRPGRHRVARVLRRKGRGAVVGAAEEPARGLGRASRWEGVDTVKEGRDGWRIVLFSIGV